MARGWSLASSSVSRTWRFQIGRSRWVAQAYVSFFFRGPRCGSVFQIFFEGKGAGLERSALVKEVRARLGATQSGTSFAWKLPDETRPSRLLAELDRISAVFGSGDRHRVPATRARSPSKRLAVIGDAVLAHGTWNLEGPTLALFRDQVSASIGPMRVSGRGRAEMSSMLIVFDREKPGMTTTLDKLQPLSLRAALAEARSLEAEIRARSPHARAPQSPTRG